MGLTKRNEKSKPKSNWTNVLNVVLNETQEGKEYLAVTANRPYVTSSGQHAGGDLFYKDKATGQIYKVNKLSIFDPHPNAPDFIQQTISLNLDNEKAATPVGSIEDFVESTDVDDETYDIPEDEEYSA